MNLNNNNINVKIIFNNVINTICYLIIVICLVMIVYNFYLIINNNINNKLKIF